MSYSNAAFDSPFGKQQPLTRRRKAALIVQLLISQGVKIELTRLPEQMQADIAHEIGQIKLVDRQTVNAVAEEFIELLEAIGMSSPGGPSAALAALSAYISPTLAKRLQMKLDGERGADPWPRIIALELEKLVRIFEAESVEVGALLLSKLPVETAAQALAALPGDRARRITFAVSQTEKTNIDTIHRIGEALQEDYCKASITAFDKTPVDRIGDILNSSGAATRDDVLTGLEDEDAELAKNVRKAIFTFNDIPKRLRPIDIPTVLREVDGDDMGTALAYALFNEEYQPTADYILENISQRMANTLRESATERGTIKDADGERAMNRVTSAIRQMADDGQINLIVPENNDD